jgi:hypothetical protein
MIKKVSHDEVAGKVVKKVFHNSDILAVLFEDGTYFCGVVTHEYDDGRSQFVINYPIVSKCFEGGILEKGREILEEMERAQHESAS